jgi:hypothetical protein
MFIFDGILGFFAVIIVTCYRHYVTKKLEREKVVLEFEASRLQHEQLMKYGVIPALPKLDPDDDGKIKLQDQYCLTCGLSYKTTITNMPICLTCRKSFIGSGVLKVVASK